VEVRTAHMTCGCTVVSSQGRRLATWVEGLGTRVIGPNSLVTLRYLTLDGHGSLVAEQLWTTVWLAVRCEEVGEGPPDHSVPLEARGRPLGTWDA
jgi:hypothetical protein